MSCISLGTKILDPNQSKNGVYRNAHPSLTLTDVAVITP